MADAAGDGLYFLGIDIGSASSKCAVINGDSELVSYSVIPAGTGTGGPRRALSSALERAGIDEGRLARIIATGYGRNTYERADGSVSELSCHAKGAAWLMPSVKTVIDIGGQDAKALSIGAGGRLLDFVMNDKCAAGTGRFLEVMARILELDVSELAEIDAKSNGVVRISSTCAVFAESEVISQLAKNVPIPDLVAGIHQSAAARAVSLIKRVGVTGPVMMTGGVAKNSGVVRALEASLGTEIRVSEYSQIAGAIGAALFAFEKTTEGSAKNG